MWREYVCVILGGHRVSVLINKKGTHMSTSCEEGHTHVSVLLAKKDTHMCPS
jgi:hypothetical protein